MNHIDFKVGPTKLIARYLSSKDTSVAKGSLFVDLDRVG